MIQFNKWLDTLIEEKGIDTEEPIEVEGPSGLNIMSVGVVLEAMKQTVGTEQKSLKNMLVKIDFMNGDVVDFIKYLAKPLAI